MNSQRFHLKRAELEDLLGNHSECQALYELEVYDFMVKAREIHELRMDEELNRALLESSPKSSLYQWRARYRHDPAYFFVLNVNPQGHEMYFQGGESSGQFIGKRLSEVADELMGVSDLDGAVLLLPPDNGGVIWKTRVQLVSVPVHPVLISRYLEGVPEDIDMDDDSLYGFRQSVNTRHRSALGASFHLTGSVVYTLGEDREHITDNQFIVESGNIRRYENGRISFSTHNLEIN